MNGNQAPQRDIAKPSNETMMWKEAVTGGLQALADRGHENGCLVKIHPAGFGEGLIKLPTDQYIIGREKDCHLALPDNAVSRQHAFIERKEGFFHVCDMGSTNGTYVNDEPVRDHRLDTGDLIRIGTHIIKFLSSDHIEAQYHETIYSMMITDGLTGVHNKRFFLESLDRELVRSQRHRRPLSLLMFDIDHFKQVNDNHTHLVGDEVLRELCNRIRPVIRRDEVFARYGGEEFTVLLPESSIAQAREFGERVRRLIADEPFAVGTLSLPVTISGGVAQTLGEREISASDLVFAADSNLYEGKRGGRNRICG